MIVIADPLHVPRLVLSAGTQRPDMVDRVAWARSQASASGRAGVLSSEGSDLGLAALNGLAEGGKRKSQQKPPLHTYVIPLLITPISAAWFSGDSEKFTSICARSVPVRRAFCWKARPDASGARWSTFW